MKVYLVGRDLSQLSESGAKRVLISYYYNSNSNVLDIRRNYFVHGVDLFIDSGGFTAKQKNIEIDVQKYGAWVQCNEEHIDIYANLDVIGNQILTKRNQDSMEGMSLSPLPVFHIGSSFREFRRLCESYSYIALGGLVPYMKNLKKSPIFPFLNKVFDMAGDTKLHGFGCVNFKILFDYPWYSVDTRSWLTGLLYREVPLFDESLKSILRIPIGNWNIWRKYRSKVEDLGYDLEEIAGRDTFNKSAILNISRKTFDEVEEYLTKRWGR
jgi:hypothetical protein